MAGLFGPAPTFGEYLEWLRKNTEYGYKSGLVPPSDTYIMIHDKDGVSIAEVFMPHNEHLVPTTIYELDKLL